MLFILGIDKAMIFLLVYIDDILHIGDNLIFFQHFITHLGTKFVIHDLRLLYYFLIIKVFSIIDGLLLSL